MKIYLLVSAMLVSIQIFGQSIHSGIWDNNDYHFNYNPDTNLYQPQNNNVNILEIDLNGDGTNDFRLSTLFRDGSQWYWEKRIEIEGLNQNQIAYSQIDSCVSNDIPPIFVYTTYSPRELNYNDIIDTNLNWTDSLVNMSFTEFDADFPTNMGFSCSRISLFQSDTGYIATRIIESNDTLYGWIKISNVNYASCVIHEFACNKNINGVNNYDLFSAVNIYPNPSSGYIKFEYLNSTTKIKSIKVYNSVGQMKKHYFVNGNNGQIDLSFLSDGLYLLYVETSFGDTGMKKIIIKRNSR